MADIDWSKYEEYKPDSAPDESSSMDLKGMLGAPQSRSQNMLSAILLPLLSGEASTPLRAAGATAKSVIADQVRENPALAFALPEANLGKAGAAVKSIPKLGKYLRPALGQALPQGTLSAAGELDQSPEQIAKSAGIGSSMTLPFSLAAEIIKSGNPYARMLGRGTSILGGGLIGHEIGGQIPIPGSDLLSTALSGYLASKGVNPERAAQSTLLKNIKITPEAQARLEAAERLRRPLTPAEATQSPFAGATQGRVGKTTPGMEVLTQAGKKQAFQEEAAINDLLDTIYNPEELGETKSKLYADTLSQDVPKGLTDDLRQNEIIKDAESRIANSSEFKQKMKGVKKDTYEYWNLVKKSLDEREQALKGKKGLKSERARLVGETRRDMLKRLDAINDDYESARNLAERDLTRKDIEKAFDKKNMTFNDFAQFLKSDKKFNDLMFKLRDIPEAQQKLKDIRLLSGKMIPLTASARAEAAGSKGHWWDPRTIYTQLAELLNEQVGKKHDVAAAELMTSPDWMSKLNEYKKPTGFEKALGEILGKTGKGVAQYESRP